MYIGCLGCIRRSGIESWAADVLGMSVVRGMRLVECVQCQCVVKGDAYSFEGVLGW